MADLVTIERPIRAALLGLIAATALLLAAPSARAAIPQVFANVPGSDPVECRVQAENPDVAGDEWLEGIRFCSNFDGAARSTVKAFDGVPIDVNAAFPPEPATGPDGDYPLVMLFHGYGGGKLGLNSMRRWLEQGYATFSLTTRGFRESCGSEASRAADPTGCEDGYIRLMDTRYEVRDAQDFAGYLVDAGLVDPDRIGGTGGSYGGGMSMALAALNDRQMLPNGQLSDWVSPVKGTPLHLAAAAPEIPWSDLAYSLTPTGSALDYVADAPYLGASGRIGIQKQTWVSILYLGGLIAPGFYAPAGTDPDADLTTWKTLLDTGGPYDGDPAAADIVDEVTSHHSSYYIDHSTPPSPLIISSGWTDDLFPAHEAIRFYNRTRTGYPGAAIALTFGDFGHPRGANKQDIQALVRDRENAWFAHYLKGEGSAPPSDVATMTQTCPSTPATPSGGPYTADSWAELAPGEVRYRSNPPQTVARQGTEWGAEYGDFIALPSAGTPCVTTDGTDNPATANYRLPAATGGGYTMMGAPTVIADFALPGSNSQVAARLFDVAPDGRQTLIGRGLWRPEVSGSRPVRQVFQLTLNGWHFAAGHVPKLELLPDDAPYGRASPGQRPVEVSKLELRLPVLESPGALGGVVQEPAEKFLPRGYHLARGFDVGPPQTRIFTRLAATNDTTPAFSFASSDVDSTFECRLDSTEEADWVACSSPSTAAPLAEGEHTFEVRATDGDANVDPSAASLTFDVDLTAPQTRITGSPPKRTTKRALKVGFKASERGARFECKLDDKAFAACASPQRYRKLGFGSHTFQVRAIDAAGNRDRSAAKLRFKVVRRR